MNSETLNDDDEHKYSKLLIQEVTKFETLYIKTIRIIAKFPNRDTGGVIGYDCPLLRRQNYRPKGSKLSKVAYHWLW